MATQAFLDKLGVTRGALVQGIESDASSAIGLDEDVELLPETAHEEYPSADRASDYSCPAELRDYIVSALGGHPLPIVIGPGRMVTDLELFASSTAMYALHHSKAVYTPARDDLKAVGIDVLSWIAER